LIFSMMETSDFAQNRICTTCGHSIPLQNFLLHRIHCGTSQEQENRSPDHEVGQVEAISEEQENRTEPLAAEEQRNGWSCNACTFINYPDADSCEMCLSENPGFSEESAQYNDLPGSRGEDMDSAFETAVAGAGLGALLAGGFSLLSGRGRRQAGQDALAGAAFGGVTGAFLPMMQQMMMDSMDRRHDDQRQAEEIRQQQRRQAFENMLRRNPELLRQFGQLAGVPNIDNMDYDQLMQIFGGPTQHPAEDGVISSLPTQTLSEEEAAQCKERDKDGPNHQCSVCLEGYEAGQEVKSLPCLHRFHSECIDHWLQTSGTCPICKHDLNNGG